MNLAELFFLSIALAMDATTVSVACSATNCKTNRRLILWMALAFGLFQGLMPVIGYFLGLSVENFIKGIDHWVAFILLAIVGGKMIVEANGDMEGSSIALPQIIVLAIATSIDALVTGITFSFIETNILFAVITIGLVTFSLSAIGGLFGRRIRFQASTMKVAGGTAIIAIGLKILIEHLLL